MADRTIRITASQVSVDARLDESRTASAVNVVGRVTGDATWFKAVRAGTKVTIDRG